MVNQSNYRDITLTHTRAHTHPSTHYHTHPPTSTSTHYHTHPRTSTCTHAHTHCGYVKILTQFTERKGRMTNKIMEMKNIISLCTYYLFKAERFLVT